MVHSYDNNTAALLNISVFIFQTINKYYNNQAVLTEMK